MAFEPLRLEDLRKGLYVKLECSWWKHPFATNKFKITSQKEIKIIKGISNLQLFFDPDLSDPLDPEPEPAPVPETSPTIDQKDQPEQEGPAELEAELPSYLQGEREDRVAAFQDRRKQFKHTEQAHQNATRQAKAALRNISSGDVAGLRSAQQMVGSLVTTLSHEQTVMALMEIMNGEEEQDPLFCHSMNVCVLSLLLGREVGLSPEDLEDLGLGALAHDIGFLSIPRQLNLTTAGFARGGADVKLHIHQGLIACSRVPDFPKSSQKIVSQHHERLNGSGYPKRLSEDDISPLAKIVMVVDEYDDLCHNAERSLNYTPYEALSFMYQNAMVHKKGDLDPELVVLLVQALGVYPPGTLVELNDGAVGVVISINSENRTKPQVLMYMKDVPRDEAFIADLAQDDDLFIEKSLRPQEVKKEMKNYLNPNRITNYFPSSRRSSTEPSRVQSYRKLAR